MPKSSVQLGLAMCAVMAMFDVPSAPAQLYQVGDTVSDFSLYARRDFTNDQGQVVPAGSRVQLTDFDGKILFLEFFHIW